MILYLISALLMVAGIVLGLNITPASFTDDVMSMLTPRDNLRELSENIKGEKQSHPVYWKIVALKNVLEGTKKSNQFAIMCTATVLLFGIGAAFAVAINNVWLAPSVALALAAIPYLYVTSMVSNYETRIQAELETALSIITISNMRSNDIVRAVQENLQYIKPPLKATFQAFIADTSIYPSINHAIINLKDRINDQIFHEWCDALVLCQNDRTLSDTLQPIIGKYTDVRIVNGEMKDELVSMQVEYWTMVGLIVANIPLMWLVNMDWFDIIMYTIPGKICLGACGMVILVTALIVFHWAKPIQYKK